MRDFKAGKEPWFLAFSFMSEVVMTVEFTNDKCEFFTIETDYVKALYSKDSEVFFDNTTDYSNKPYIGILVSSNNYKYFIPLTSAKDKHKKWKNKTKTNYVIYEMIDKSKLRPKDIYREVENSDEVKKILAVLEIKKMIPVKDGLYHKVEFSVVSDLSYKALLEKEYEFCKPLLPEIVKKAQNIYNKQKNSGIVEELHCNFSLLEEICDSY